MKNKNYVLLLTWKTIHTVSTLAYSGAILTGFLLATSFSESTMALYLTVTSISSIVGYIVSYVIADKIKRVKLAYTVTRGIAMVFLIPMLIVNNVEVSYALKIVMFFGGTFISSLFGSICTSLDYKYCLLIMDKDRFVKYVSSCVILCYGASFGGSVLISALVNVTDYKSFINAVLLVAIALSIITLILMALIKFDKNKEIETATKERFKLKVWYPFFISDFLSGFATGIVGLAIAFATLFKIIDNTTTTYLTVTGAVATMLAGCITYFLKKEHAFEGLFITCVLIGVTFVLMFVTRNLYVYLILSTIQGIATTSSNNCTSIFIGVLIKPKELGGYTARRAVVVTSGSALASFVSSFFMNTDQAMYLIVLSGILFVISALVYLIKGKKMKRQLA